MDSNTTNTSHRSTPSPPHSHKTSPPTVSNTESIRTHRSQGSSHNSSSQHMARRYSQFQKQQFHPHPQPSQKSLASLPPTHYRRRNCKRAHRPRNASVNSAVWHKSPAVHSLPRSTARSDSPPQTRPHYRTRTRIHAL